MESNTQGVVVTGFSYARKTCSAWAFLPIKAFFILSMAINGSMASASQQVELYSVQALVKTQSEADRNAAARAAFADVLVRTSGRKDVVSHEDVASALKKAQQYLFGFSYQNVSATLGEGDDAVPAIGLNLQFDSAAVEQLLRKAHLPLWPSTRPQVLVWIVVNDETGIRSLTSEEQQALQSQSAYRGLPLLFPRWDIEDASYVSTQQIWDGWVSEVKAASQRYQADAILIGRITPSQLNNIPSFRHEAYVSEDAFETSASSSSVASESSVESDDALEEGTVAAEPIGPFRGDWLLIQNDNQQAFGEEFPALSDMLRAATDVSADFLAKLYAISPSTNSGESAGTRVLRIGNITSFAAFKQAQEYVRSIAMVTSMDVISVDSDGMLLRLAVEGDLRLLTSTLALGRRLVPVEAPLSESQHQPSGTTDLDAAALRELELALANELSIEAPSDTATEVASPSPVLPEPAMVRAASGTLEDPLMYNWQ
jgi:hypothetical protein